MIRLNEREFPVIWRNGIAIIEFAMDGEGNFFINNKIRISGAKKQRERLLQRSAWSKIPTTEKEREELKKILIDSLPSFVFFRTLYKIDHQHGLHEVEEDELTLCDKYILDMNEHL